MFLTEIIFKDEGILVHNKSHFLDCSSYSAMFYFFPYLIWSQNSLTVTQLIRKIEFQKILFLKLQGQRGKNSVHFSSRSRHEVYKKKFCHHFFSVNPFTILVHTVYGKVKSQNVKIFFSIFALREKKVNMSHCLCTLK